MISPNWVYVWLPPPFPRRNRLCGVVKVRKNRRTPALLAGVLVGKNALLFWISVLDKKRQGCLFWGVGEGGSPVT